ncbi:MAG TPA: hypothetical protein VGD88_11500 [Opitutaceae bacterium]
MDEPRPYIDLDSVVGARLVRALSGSEVAKNRSKQKVAGAR